MGKERDLEREGIELLLVGLFLGVGIPLYNNSPEWAKIVALLICFFGGCIMIITGINKKKKNQHK